MNKESNERTTHPHSSNSSVYVSKVTASVIYGPKVAIFLDE